MSIAAVGTGHSAPISQEKAEPPGPDHDGDGDDAGAQTTQQAAPPPGTGAVIDKMA